MKPKWIGLIAVVVMAAAIVGFQVHAAAGEPACRCYDSNARAAGYRA